MDYEFKAVNKDGQKIGGLRQTADKVSLARELREEGYFLVWAKEKIQSAGGRLGAFKKWYDRLESSLAFLLKRVSLAEKMTFARHLSLMIRAGFSLNKALDTLTRQTKNKYFAGVLKEMSQGVAQGKSFYEVMAQDGSHSAPSSREASEGRSGATRGKRVFSPIFMSMVKVGEASGKLEGTLKMAALQLHREYALKKKIKGAMTYPIVVLVALAGVAAIMVLFVLPQLASTFSELNVTLPLSTRIVFGFVNWVSHWWYAAFGILAAEVYGLYFFTRRTELGRISVNYILLKLPIFSELTKKLNSARLARTLGSLLSSGVPLTEAIKITADSLTNVFYKRALVGTVADVEKGQPLSGLLGAHADLFPPVVTEMMAVGEETGSLTTILAELARFFEAEVSAATKNMSSVVEPIIMIIVGIAVGIFALSIIQPIYSITESIG
ncbi:MAG: type II secretion system F family protein [Patescibacteria group bacterium]